MGLGGEFEPHVGGADLLQAVVDDAMRQFGAIAFAAQVAEVKMAQVGGHDLLGGISGGFVREVAMPAQDALLEAPGAARAILEHLDVVVGLQHQGMGGADPFEHQPGGVAKVGQETDVAGAGAQQEADRVLGVVRNAERLDQDVAHLEAGAGGEEPAGQPRLELVLDRLLRRAGCSRPGCAASRSAAGRLCTWSECSCVTRIAGQVLRRAANGGEALANLAQAETRVDQHAGLVGFHIGAVAGGTAARGWSGEQAQLTLRSGQKAGQCFSWLGYFFGRLAWSCSQATSGLLGESKMSGRRPPCTTGGMVRLSRQRRNSEWPSAKEKPQAK